MSEKTLESWMWGNPADVVERKELQDNAAAAREMAKLNDRLAKSAQQERMRAKVFRKARTA